MRWLKINWLWKSDDYYDFELLQMNIFILRYPREATFLSIGWSQTQTNRQLNWKHWQPLICNDNDVQYLDNSICNTREYWYCRHRRGCSLFWKVLDYLIFWQRLSKVRFVRIHQQGAVVVGVGLTQFCCRTRYLKEIISYVEVDGVPAESLPQVIGTYLLASQQNVISFWDVCLDAPLAEQSARDKVQVVPSVVALAGCKERAVEVARVVVHSSSTAVSPRQDDSLSHKFADVGLREGILMAAYDHARVVNPKHKNMMLGKVVVAIDPVLERQIREHVVALRYEDGLLDGRFRWLLGCVPAAAATSGKAIGSLDSGPPRSDNWWGKATNRTGRQKHPIRSHFYPNPFLQSQHSPQSSFRKLTWPGLLAIGRQHFQSLNNYKRS